jgi:hypothetical protein
MICITDVEEAEDILELDILSPRESREVVDEYPTADWVLIGSMQTEQKELKYKFSAPGKWTMYSYNLGVRRWLTPHELEIAKDLYLNK